MNGRRVLLLLGSLAPLAGAACATDVTGDWQVTISTAGGTIMGRASLRQTGDAVTGWVGPSETDPIPITGTFRNGKLALKTLPQAGRTVAFDSVHLTVARDTMSGAIELGSQGKGTIRFARSP